MSRGCSGRVVGVQAEAAILQFDDQFDGAIVLARGEIHQGVFVAAQFGIHFVDGLNGRQWTHAFMLA